MSEIIDLDPETRRDIMSRAMNDFDKVLDKILKEMGEDVFSMDWKELAQLFFYHGHVNGAIADATDDDFHDAVLLMAEEIEYQRK